MFRNFSFNGIVEFIVNVLKFTTGVKIWLTNDIKSIKVWHMSIETIRLSILFFYNY